MGKKMKANRKFIKDKEAVSAVIGVILMVAITVAVVGILWGYLSGFFTGAPVVNPKVSMTQDGNYIDIIEVTQGTVKASGATAYFVKSDGSSAGTGTINDLNGNGNVDGADTITPPAGLTSGTEYTVKLVYNGATVGTTTFTAP